MVGLSSNIMRKMIVNEWDIEESFGVLESKELGSNPDASMDSVYNFD